MESSDEFPAPPEVMGRAESLEASASTVWTLLFLAYSSSTFVSEFGHGWPAVWTVGLVILPIVLAGLPNVLDGRRHAIPILASYLLYAIVPAIVQLTHGAGTASDIADAVTVVVLWLPLEFHVLSPRLSPTGKVSVWGLLTAALTILNTFKVLCPLSERPRARPLGYSFKLSPLDALVALPMSAVCIATVAAIAALSRFAKVSRRPVLREKPQRELAAFVGLYMSALTEELLFRGLIQNLLEQRSSPTSIVALAIASAAYAAAHLSKQKLGFQPPNVRFALCAFVSGAFYGVVWRLTGKVTASAITHAVVDFTLYRVLLTDISRAA